nr:glycosyltransferase [Paenalcaligenes hominis]
MHENVLAAARFLVNYGHKATIVCPAGSFSDSLANYCIGVIRTDYTDLNATINEALKLHAADSVDLVHAHPFASRKFGLALAEQLDVPLVLTFHGKYTDNLPRYIDKVSTVLTVSSGVRDYLLNEKAGSPEKFQVVPNVPDTDFFQPLLDKPQSNEGKLKAALVSRLDKDKDFILDVFCDAVEYAGKHYSGEITWVVVGDGTQTESFRSRLEVVRGGNTIEFRGWLEDEVLRSAYQSSDFVFAPGRCALEAMSCGVPVIAVGSKSYCGLVNANTWQQGVYSNFGGVGNQHRDYKPEMVHSDLSSLLTSKSYRAGLGAFGIKIIQQFFDAQKVHEQLLGVYRLVILSHALGKGGSVSEASGVENSLAILKNKKIDTKSEDNIEQLEKKLLAVSKENAAKITRDLLIVQNRLYAQLESLSWLQRRLRIKGQLPPLRGWATSPDVLLHLQTHIMATRPRIIVEFGSGASTLVIADALRQNGIGKLISIEHSHYYGAQTLSTLQAESLEDWVDLRIGELEAWEGEHLNPADAEKVSRWYSVSLLEGVHNIDLLWVGGLPGATCLYSRYPALPTLASQLSVHAEVWMDDTTRQEEQDICERWAKDYGFELDYLPLEKGLGRLRRIRLSDHVVSSIQEQPVSVDGNEIYSERVIGLDFSLPNDSLRG